MKKDNFNNDLPESTPEEKPFSFNDLDLGLDFDLSFLDDIDETVLEEEAPAKKPAAPKEVPAKKPAAEQKSAPAKKASPAQKDVPGKKPASAQGAAAGKKAAPSQNAAAKKAAPAQPAAKAPAKKPPVPQEEPVKKKKKGPRMGGVIFYTLYFMFILIFFLGTYLGLQWLHGWLNDYEQAQPTVKAQQVFTQLFTSPNWGDLYDAAGAQDSPYEGKEEYVAYMEQLVSGRALTYEETSAGLSGDKKYVVRLDNVKVASFTLVDKNKVGTTVSLENLENIGDIPDWQLGAVEVFFEREGTYLIEKLDGHTAYVNDVALDDSFTIQIATTKAAEYLPEGTTGFSMCTQQVTGLMSLPTVTIFDKSGNQMEVTYDETTRTFTERTESNTMSDEEKEVALKAAETNCLWMIEEVTDRGTVAKYFDPSSDAYNEIVKTTELWMQNHGAYEFLNETVTNYARYTEDIFSIKVSMDLNVARTDGSIKTWPYERTLFFQKSASGNWLCFKATNVDVSQPVGKVRLTFMQGDTQIHTDFYSTDADEIITPIIPVPDGQVFTGWVTVSENEEGATVYNLEFQPDATTGKVSIPDGTSLKPMTLYALFQNADEAQEITVVDVPAETSAPETVPAETVAETTAPAETAAPETTEGA